MACSACFMPKQHVFFGGTKISELDANQIQKILDDYAQVKPIHVNKGKVYTREAYDFNRNEVEYDVELVKEDYENSCICQNTNIIPTLSNNNDNNNSNNDMNFSSSVLSFYTERKEQLAIEIEQRNNTISRKRKEVEDEESIVSKRKKELDLVNQILNL